eukprot:6163690-Pleurochrysis_carterae.AAC.8
MEATSIQLRVKLCPHVSSSTRLNFVYIREGKKKSSFSATNATFWFLTFTTPILGAETDRLDLLRSWGDAAGRLASR